MSSNATGPAVWVEREEEMRAYDALPAEARRALAGAAFNYSAKRMSQGMPDVSDPIVRETP